jgi:hypothetical protein
MSPMVSTAAAAALFLIAEVMAAWRAILFIWMRSDRSVPEITTTYPSSNSADSGLQIPKPTAAAAKFSNHYATARLGCDLRRSSGIDI